jgi:hypothetical protein
VVPSVLKEYSAFILEGQVGQEELQQQVKDDPELKTVGVCSSHCECGQVSIRLTSCLLRPE